MSEACETDLPTTFHLPACAWFSCSCLSLQVCGVNMNSFLDM